MKIKTQFVDLTLNNVPTIDDQDFIVDFIDPNIEYIRQNLINLGFENADLYLAATIRSIGENLVYYGLDDDLTLTQIANYVIDHPCNYPDELFINYVNELLQNFNLNPIVRPEIL